MTSQTDKFKNRKEKFYEQTANRGTPNGASNKKANTGSSNSDESSKPQTFSSFGDLANLEQEENTSTTPNIPSNNTGENNMTEENTPKRVSDLNLDANFLDSGIFQNLGISLDSELTDDIRSKIDQAKTGYDESLRNSPQSNENGAAPTNNEDDKPSPESTEAATIGENDENTGTDTVTFESNEQSSDDWRKEYNEILSKYAQEKEISWERTSDDTYEGLKGKLDNVEMNFTSPKEAVIHTQDASEEQTLRTAEALLQIAKEKNLVIPYHEEWSDKLKAAMEQLRQENPEYFVEFPAKEEAREKTREETNDVPQLDAPEHKLNPKIAKAKIELYSQPNQKVDLDTRIAKEKELLSKGQYKVTGEDKAKGEILMMQYAQALSKGNTDTANDCITALKRYGIENIERVPDQQDGAFNVTAGATYSQRSKEEQQQIDQATEKLLGKPNETNNRQAIHQLNNEGR